MILIIQLICNINYCIHYYFCGMVGIHIWKLCNYQTIPQTTDEYFGRPPSLIFFLPVTDHSKGERNGKARNSEQYDAIVVFCFSKSSYAVTNGQTRFTNIWHSAITSLTNSGNGSYTYSRVTVNHKVYRQWSITWPVVHWSGLPLNDLHLDTILEVH